MQVYPEVQDKLADVYDVLEDAHYDAMGHVHNENISERTLTKAEKKKMKSYEKDIKKKDFIERYGKEKGESVYALITQNGKKMSKGESVNNRPTTKVGWCRSHKPRSREPSMGAEMGANMQQKREYERKKGIRPVMMNGLDCIFPTLSTGEKPMDK